MNDKSFGVRTSASLCTFCSHSVGFHGAGGCQALIPGKATQTPRPCPCERDAVAATHAVARKPRHLTLVK